MGKDIEYTSLFSGTTKRFNSTIPLSTLRLILKVAEGPEYTTLMYSPKNHRERVLYIRGSFDLGRPVAGLRLVAVRQAVGTYRKPMQQSSRSS